MNIVTRSVPMAGVVCAAVAATALTPVSPTMLPIQPQVRSVALTSIADDLAGVAAGSVPFIDFTDGHLELLPLGPTLDLFGLGGVHLNSVVDFIGLGDAPVGGLLTGLVDGLGLGDDSFVQLADGLGLGGMHLNAFASILQLVGENVPALGSLTFGGLVDGVGLGQVQIGAILTDLGGGGLITELLNALGTIPGLGGLTTVDSLLTLVGLDDAPVLAGLEGLLNDPNIPLGGETIDQLLAGLGIGDTTLDQLLGSGSSSLLDALDLGSVDDLLSGTGVDNATIDDLLNGLDLFDHYLISF